jgi:thiol-disulfide isomerase/thioredoxin
MPETNNPTRIRNLAIAFVAIALSVALFLGFQSQSHSTSLEAQAKQSVPLEVALSDNKPTLTEFYANWCTSCQAMAPALAQLKQKYGDSVNFAMLNVDNTKWLPEILRYRVDGIPHFVFFGANGEEIAQVVGEQPVSVMDANLTALVANVPLPYAAASGETSRFSPPTTTSSTDPRSHGAQVKL